MARFIHRWARVRAGPVIVTAYVALAIALGSKGAALGQRVFGGDVSPISSASASAVLSAIASGMMALTAIVFSLVFVAVQYSGTSYSPRLVRLVGEKRFLAHALGIFTGTFIYALVALRSVDIAGRAGIELYIVGFAFAWLAASVVVLVLLLPRTRGLAIEEVLLHLQQRARTAAVRLYPERGAHVPGPAHAPDLPVTGVLVHANLPKYFAGLDEHALVRYASEVDAVILIPFAIGDAVSEGERLAVVHGGRRPLSAKRLRRAIWLANERVVDNDPGYAIRLMVDIAIRALSPAINDPTTGVSVIDQLDGLLRFLARRDLEANVSCDSHGVVRLVRAVPSWHDYVALALTEIHQYGCESVQIEHRLAALVHDLSDGLPADRRDAIESFALRRARTLVDAARGQVQWLDPSARDRQGIGHER